MEKFKIGNYVIEYYFKPNIEGENTLLLKKSIFELGSACFSEIPNYQCFESLEDKVIVLIKSNTGKPLAFCSGIILKISKSENSLHFGLVCIHPKHRNTSLLMLLYFVMGVRTLYKMDIVENLSVTNLSCDIGILRMFGRFLSLAYPSPHFKGKINEGRYAIAKVIDERYRKDLFISPTAIFDSENFVFRGSVKDTVFSKSIKDIKQNKEAEYFISKMNYNDGDEILQVAYLNHEAVEETMKFMKRIITDCDIIIKK